jgi:hypothetical protein
VDSFNTRMCVLNLTFSHQTLTDDFFPHEVDFSALISEDEVLNVPATTPAAPSAGGRNLRAKAAPVISAPTTGKSQRKAAAASRRPAPVESEEEDDEELSDGQRVERR